MATRRIPRTTGVVVSPSGDPEETDTEHDDDAEQSPESIGERIASALSQTSEVVKCSLHRIDPKTGKMPWCCDYSVEEFQTGGLEMIRASWGPGDYELRLTGSRGMIKGGRPRFTIAAPMLGMQMPQPANNTAANETNQLIRLMVEGQQAIMAKLAAPPPPAPPPPPRMTPAEIGGMITAGAAALGALKDLFGGKAATPDTVGQITQLLGAVTAVKQAQRELRDDDDAEPKETNVMDLAKQGLGLVSAAMAQRNQLPAVNAPAGLLTATGGGGDTPLPPLPTDTPHEDENPMLGMIIKGIVAKLMDAADKGADPAASAAFLVNHPMVGNQISPLLELPNWLEILQAHPLFAPYAADFKAREAWFTRMRDEAVKIIEGDDA